MAKQRITPQSYPRIQDPNDDYYGMLDVEALESHKRVVTTPKLKSLIKDAIRYANLKSSRVILDIPENTDEVEIKRIYRKKGKELFVYFRKYCGDPAATAYDCQGKHFTIIAREQFRNRSLQKERMNSGWRFQFIAKGGAQLTGRFVSVSDIGSAEADFNAVIRQRNSAKNVAIYASIKNRSNTMGGQDWPKAIQALETVAINDRNRSDPYLCVFGMVMDRGMRYVKVEGRRKMPHSINTEIWLSDFFWPFFINKSYSETMKLVLSVLQEVGQTSNLDMHIPNELLDTFGDLCQEFKLVDEDGKFNNPERLVDFFCGNLG